MVFNCRAVGGQIPRDGGVQHRPVGRDGVLDVARGGHAQPRRQARVHIPERPYEIPVQLVVEQGGQGEVESPILGGERLVAGAVRGQRAAQLAQLLGRIRIHALDHRRRKGLVQPAAHLDDLAQVGKDGVFITPTLADCVAVAETGCEVVALDGTRRARPDGLSLAETVAGLKERFPEVLVMADCGSAGDAVAAQEAGADLIGTTLVGYSGERPKTDGPDWEAVDEMLAVADRPLIVEGRLHTPADAAEAMRRGAWSVVVGTAITHPSTITRWFADALPAATPG